MKPADIQEMSLRDLLPVLSQEFAGVFFASPTSLVTANFFLEYHGVLFY